MMIVNMKSAMIILGAVLPYLTRVTADETCFNFDEKAYPLQWKDAGWDEFQHCFSSRVCSFGVYQ